MFGLILVGMLAFAAGLAVGCLWMHKRIVDDDKRLREFRDNPLYRRMQNIGGMMYNMLETMLRPYAEERRFFVHRDQECVLLNGIRLFLPVYAIWIKGKDGENFGPMIYDVQRQTIAIPKSDGSGHHWYHENVAQGAALKFCDNFLEWLNTRQAA